MSKSHATFDKESDRRYDAFFAVLKLIAEYSFDMSAGESFEGQKLPLIADEVFLRELYAKRAVEDTIKIAIQTNPSYVCLIGLKGSGKSSVMLKVRHDLESIPHNRFHFLRIDMNTDNLRTLLERNNYEDFYRLLSNRLKDAFFLKYFPFKDNNPDVALQYYAFVLSDLPRNIAPEDIFSCFQELRSEAVIRREAQYKGKQLLPVMEWLKDNYPDASILVLKRAIDRRTDLVHLMHASKHIYKISRHVLLFDNVDALPDQMQGELAKHIEKFYVQISRFASIVLTIRSENAVIEEALKGGGTHPMPLRVLMEIDNDEHGRRSFPAIEMPYIKLRELKRVFAKRFAFALLHQSELLADLKGKIQAGDINFNDKELQEIILGYYGPELLRQERRSLSRLFIKLFHVLDNERFIYLTNSNLRDLLKILRDFSGNLTRDGIDKTSGRLVAEAYEDWYLTTRLYSWIRRDGAKYSIGVYDTLKQNASAPISDGDIGVRCVLPYLIITTIWNLENAYKKDSNAAIAYIKVSKIYTNLLKLGFIKPDIRQTLFHFYRRHDTYGHVINFKGYVSIKDPEDIRDDHRIYLLPQAKTLASTTAISFGYFYECVRQHEEQTKGISKDKRVPGTEESAQKIFPYLLEICQTHFQSLKTMRDRNMMRTKKWLDEYLKLFGMPIENPYSKLATWKSLTTRSGKLLLVQAILRSIFYYIRNTSESEKYWRLHVLFDKSLNALEYELDKKPGSVYTNLNFQSEILKEKEASHGD